MILGLASWRTCRVAASTLILAASLVAPSAIAQTAPASADRDPNEKVCETSSQVGSRLSKKKICATRAEWAEMKRQDRETVEQVQRATRIGCSVAPASTNGPVPTC